MPICSEEMLNIFYDYTLKHYIDVYYNDVVCLKNTIKIIDSSVSGNGEDSIFCQRVFKESLGRAALLTIG